MAPEINIPNNTEIDKALKEFEVKQNLAQTPNSPEVLETSDAPKMVKLVMKISGGAIKEQKQAEYILLGFVVVAIVISLFLMFGEGGNTPKKPPDGILEEMKLTPANQ